MEKIWVSICLKAFSSPITMVIQWEGYQPRREEQVDTILLWDVNLKETKKFCHLGFSSDSESVQLVKVSILQLRSLRLKEEERFIQSCVIQYGSH